EDDAKRKDICTRIKFFASRLLRRHVDGGPRYHPNRSQRILDRAVTRNAHHRIARELGEAEVKNLRLSVCCQKDVCWLDIAVYDPFRMRGRERIRDLNRDIKQLFNFNGVSAYALFQALTFQLLH